MPASLSLRERLSTFLPYTTLLLVLGLLLLSVRQGRALDVQNHTLRNEVAALHAQVVQLKNQVSSIDLRMQSKPGAREHTRVRPRASATSSDDEGSTSEPSGSARAGRDRKERGAKATAPRRSRSATREEGRTGAKAQGRGGKKRKKKGKARKGRAAAP